ncbi:MAG: DegV family protein [Negativicutes bacterium]|nr:DegV family protein [Negativicutes bacterium]
MVHVVIDSTAQVPAELLQRYKNLHVVPLRVIIGSEEWAENRLHTTELFSLARSKGHHPKTSQPAPGDFISVLKPLIADGHQIIVITLSGGLSGTVGGARAAAQMVESNNIIVVDSGTTAMGMVQMARAALTMAEAGETLESIAQLVENMARLTYTMFVPNTLEYLHKGGRIGGAAALFGTILQIKPLLYLVNGKVAVLDKVRTRPRAVSRMVEELKKQERLAYIGVGYIDCRDEAEAVGRQLKELYPDTPIIMSELGPVLGVHLGPGLIGLIYQEAIS